MTETATDFKAPKKTRAALYGFLILALFAPFIVGAAGGNYWVRVLDFALLYIMLALGLNIVVGFAGLLDLGYIAFYAVGAYMMGLLGASVQPVRVDSPAVPQRATSHRLVGDSAGRGAGGVVRHPAGRADAEAAW